MSNKVLTKLKSIIPPSGSSQIETLCKFLKLESFVNTSDPFHYLSDRKSGRVILFSNDHEVIRTLTKVSNTHACYNVTIKNHLGARNWEIPEELNYACPWDYEDMTQKVYSNSCKKMTIPLSHDQMYEFYLLNQKYQLLTIMFSIIKTLQNELGYPMEPIQSSIYQEKYRQACNVLDGIDSEKQYIESWAEINGYDLLTSAKDIKLNYDLFHIKLSKLENVRLMFIKKVIEEQDVLNMGNLLDEFKMFNFGYMKL